MSRRPGRELETLPHFIYTHHDEMGNVIYAGRTSDPKRRPYDASKRSWIKTESSEVRVSPPMPFDLACWVESALIDAVLPKHNTRSGESPEANRDPRLDRYCEVFGVTRAVARWALAYMPRDPEQFEQRVAEQVAMQANARIEPRSGRSKAAQSRKSA